MAARDALPVRVSPRRAVAAVATCSDPSRTVFADCNAAQRAVPWLLEKTVGCAAAT
jgi:hypothetical protein